MQWRFQYPEENNERIQKENKQNESKQTQNFFIIN